MSDNSKPPFIYRDKNGNEIKGKAGETPPPYVVPGQGIVKPRNTTEEKRRRIAERLNEARTKNVTFRITLTEYEKLKEIAEKEGVNISMLFQEQIGSIFWLAEAREKDKKEYKKKMEAYRLKHTKDKGEEANE